MRRTKIIATVGPATTGSATITELIAAGVDVFRLNFSHGTRDDHARAVEHIRASAEQLGRPVAVLQDLAGPKIRTGRLVGGSPLHLHKGDTLRIVVGDIAGSSDVVSTTNAELPKALRPGDMILLDDGKIQLEVKESSPSEVVTSVIDGGLLGEHKGINAPGVMLPAGLTAKDVEDLKFGVRCGIDLLAVSFVQSGDDLRSARSRLQEAGAPDVPLIAKLERAEAVSHIDDILDAADAVMIARGDLGLELPLEHVPRVQKEVTRRARMRGVPVIVATQVLESMRTESRPTRAEVSDAAYAADSGVDAILLTGETAVGLYPVRAVQTLDAILRAAEAVPAPAPVPLEGTRLLGGHGRAMCEAAVTLAARGDAVAIVALTRGGKTARLLSALRPRVPIYAATDRPEIARRLALVWGVAPVVADLSGDISEAANRIGQILVTRGSISPSSVIALVSITPDLARGPSNFLKLERV
jgi:pyruvate kinase